MTDTTARADAAAANGTLMRRTAWAAVAVAAILIVLKTIAYIVTDSIAMMASLADSALDIFASSINVIAIRSALTPADAEHRFGHGKAEPLAGLVQAAFLFGSVAFLVIESASRLIAPHKIEQGAVALAVMAVSIGLTVALVAFQQFTVRRTKSLAIGADRMHYAGDLLTNIGVVVGVVLSTQFGFLEADPIIGIVVAAVLAFSAWHVFLQSYNQLMDRELPDSDRAKIKTIVMRHPEVRNLHDLRTRAAGVHTFIQFHIELDPTISITRAHEISDAVEHEVCTEFPNSEVIIHQDPAGLEKPPALARS